MRPHAQLQPCQIVRQLSEKTRGDPDFSTPYPGKFFSLDSRENNSTKVPSFSPNSKKSSEGFHWRTNCMSIKFLGDTPTGTHPNDRPKRMHFFIRFSAPTSMEIEGSSTPATTTTSPRPGDGSCTNNLSIGCIFFACWSMGQDHTTAYRVTTCATGTRISLVVWHVRRFLVRYQRRRPWVDQNEHSFPSLFFHF